MRFFDYFRLGKDNEKWGREREKRQPSDVKVINLMICLFQLIVSFSLIFDNVFFSLSKVNRQEAHSWWSVCEIPTRFRVQFIPSSIHSLIYTKIIYKNKILLLRVSQIPHYQGLYWTWTRSVKRFTEIHTIHTIYTNYNESNSEIWREVRIFMMDGRESCN